MKNLIIFARSFGALLLRMTSMSLLLLCSTVSAEHLTIVGINDTHSMVLPDTDGKGGFLRQRALIDSVRAADKNVIAVHAGDAVQGTPFFNYFGGEIEYQSLDSLGFDYIILGNHEFDNGILELYKYYSRVKTPKLCANYKFSDPRMQQLFKPYDIVSIGGKRVAFMGINVNPEGLLNVDNIKGLTYTSAVKAANELARELKEEKKADYVVMISHIGYRQEDPGQEADLDVLAESEYIDIVVGGHSHTVIKPNNGSPDAPSLVKNKNGKDVLVTQTGIYGKRMTIIDLDLETGEVNHKLVWIDSRLDDRAAKYTAMAEWIDGFKKVIDEDNSRIICYSAEKLMNREPSEAPDWLADAMMEMCPDFYRGKVDCACINKGGIRHPIQAGPVTEGFLKGLLPFYNNFEVLKLKGRDLIAALKVMASRGGDGISSELYCEYDKDFNITKATLNGKPIKNDKNYYVLTIYYLATGGDFLESFKNGKVVFRDDRNYLDPIRDYLIELNKKGKKIEADKKPRMVQVD